MIYKLLNAYIISGLGADSRVFENLSLPSQISVRHVTWIEPLKNEPLTDYCLRISDQIDTREPFILIGMSFGGIVAVELNKILRPLTTIIISSVSTYKEFPLIFRFIHLTKLYRVVPTYFFKIPNPFTYWYFGVSSKEEKALLDTYMKEVSNNYMSWSIEVILNWKNKERPSGLFHIHGTRDRIFPYKKTNADVLIKDGGHLMVHNRAEEVSLTIREYLKK